MPSPCQAGRLRCLVQCCDAGATARRTHTRAKPSFPFLSPSDAFANSCLNCSRQFTNLFVWHHVDIIRRGYILGELPRPVHHDQLNREYASLQLRIGLSLASLGVVDHGEDSIHWMRAIWFYPTNAEPWAVRWHADRRAL